MEVTTKTIYSTLGKYKLIKLLGTGHNSKVKLAHDPETNQHYAVKIIKHSHPEFNYKCVKSEIDVLSVLKHENVISFVEFHDSVQYVKKNGSCYPVTAIVLELMVGGELFDYISGSGRFSEEVARTYFHALIETVEHCHSKGVAHRDLKVENLLLDSNFNLKVADFGSAVMSSRINDRKVPKNVFGTEGYVAPEILMNRPFNDVSADLFSCAVILFIMISESRPFSKADPHNDSLYKLIASNQTDKFWQIHEKSKPKESGKGFYSEELKDLLNSMFSLDPSWRLNYAEIKSHPWYNGPTVSKAELQKEFVERKNKIDTQKQRAKNAKEQQKLIAQAKLRFMGAGLLYGLQSFPILRA